MRAIRLISLPIIIAFGGSPSISVANDCREACNGMHQNCKEKQIKRCTANPDAETDFESDCVEELSLCDELLETCMSECDPQAEEENVPVVQPKVEPENAQPATKPPATSESDTGKEDYYNQILKDSKELDRDWRSVVRIARTDDIPLETKIEAVEHFISQYGIDNKHAEEANLLLKTLLGSRLENGGSATPHREIKKIWRQSKEPGPEFYRGKTEWMSMRLGGGLLGASLTMTLFTPRWDHFYWNIMRGTFIGGNGFGGHWGMGIGIPFALDSKAQKEIRLGLILDGGIMVATRFGDRRYEAYGPMPGLELLFIRHLRTRFGFLLGLEIHLFPNAYYHTDNGGRIDTWGVPHVCASLGFTV